MIFTSDGMSPTPYRWWLRRSGRNWSICDWEMIDLGQSEADRWARTHAIGYEGPAGKYWQAAASVTRAQDESGAGRHAAAVAQLKDAEKQQVSAELHDMNAIDIAFAWLDAGRPDLALAAADRAASPEFQIGAQQVRVQALAKLDRPDDLLAALAKYCVLAGCHPDLLRIEAQALEAAGRRKEAAECWWQSLRLMPDDRQSLFEFCRLAGSERQADIRQHLSKGKKPVERAAQAAREAIFQDEVAAAEAIVAYIRETEPDSTVLLSLAAQQYEQAQQHAKAAEQYLLAHQREEHPERKQEHFRAYLASMAYADKVAEAYRTAEDKVAAWDYLTEGHEYDESLITDDVLEELIAEHRELAPSNPRLMYFAARLLLRNGDYAAAAEHFVKAEAAEDEELQDLIRAGRREAIYRQGSIKRAYEAYETDREAAFRDLAWKADERGDFSGLGELLGLHARQVPSDPWLGYFTARREQAAENYTAAIAALAPAEAAEEPGLTSLCSRLKIDLYIKSNNASQAYRTGGKPQEAFLRIAGRLAELDDWEGLLDLANLHGAAVPADATSLYYQTKAHWHLGQYAQLAQNMTPWPAERLKSLDQAWVGEIADLYVRSWLRVPPSEGARSAAERIRDDLGLTQPLVTVELKLGNRQRAKELLADPLIGRDFFLNQLQFDAECAALLTDPEFADVRKRYALERPNEYGRRTASLVLLLKEPLDEAAWRAAFDLAAGPAAAQARDLSFNDEMLGPVRVSRLVDLPGGTLILTARAVPYCPAKEFSAAEISAGSPLRKALEEHTAWIALDACFAEELAAAKDLELAMQKLAGELGGENVLAIFGTRPRRGPPRFAPADEEVREQLAGGTFLALDGAGSRDSVYLYESSGDEESAADDETWRECSRALSRAIRIGSSRKRSRSCADSRSVRAGPCPRSPVAERRPLAPRTL